MEYMFSFVLNNLYYWLQNDPKTGDKDQKANILKSMSEYGLKCI